mmetsp:Transcript_31353/g.50427  ORF Transcript_31353/g.50427 Transcript_31353/m.50427 type:complete len:757 (+) Transcript_31353:59-2329(+)
MRACIGRAMAMLFSSWVLLARPFVKAETLATGLAPSWAPTKGNMSGIVGDMWTLSVDPSEADHLDFLPEVGPLSAGREAELKNETLGSYQYLKDYGRYRGYMLAGGYYTSGKGFQKVGMVCLLLERFFSASDNRTQECAEWMGSCFRCYYDATAAATDFCKGTSQSYYDEDWGGLASRFGWDRMECNSDYGNTCYNDHHYHFGYFVVSGAILAKLNATYLKDELFVAYVNTLIRDTTNPSGDDAYFPRFRSFDWFDLHSWSHGLPPSFDGKDQESTSEELNLLWGLVLWGRVTENSALQRLGATMLTLAAHTVRELFLMKTGNIFHPPDFVKNHVTGVFLQGKVDYTTWFGSAPEYIHGIQMLPLSPALVMTRKTDFCKEEWDDILSKVGLGTITKPWASVLLTGSLAIIDPDLAYTKLLQIEDTDMDGGLTRAWALYWTNSRPGEQKTMRKGAGKASAPVASLTNPVGAGDAPAAMGDGGLFPAKRDHPVFPPAGSCKTKAPRQTNKFWANWLVKDGLHYPIFSMPYALSWGGLPEASALQVSHSKQKYIYGTLPDHRMKTYITPNVPDFYLTANEAIASGPLVVSEGLFGMNVTLSGDGTAELTFPIYTGMAYVSGHYSGGFTPKVSHPHGIKSLAKVSPGTWSFINRRVQEYRVYVLTDAGDFADETFEFDKDGVLNQMLQGWVRIAHVLTASDVEVLDAHARAVVVGLQLDIDGNGTAFHYRFEKAGAQDLEVLHFAYGHQMQLMTLPSKFI